MLFFRKTNEQLSISKEVQEILAPLWNVILLNDDDHTYEYVIRMLKEIFGYPEPKGFEMAREVDTRGRVICATLPLEHAELKQEQIHSFGADPLVPRCVGSMTAILEPTQ